MKVLHGIQTRVVIAMAMLALCAPAVAERGLYQWVDGAGNVIYGDSPPTVTHSRTVEPVGSQGPLREIPGYLAKAKTAGQGEPPQQPVQEQQALTDALNRLESMMSRMQDLTNQVDRLEDEKIVLRAESEAGSGSRKIARHAAELALQGPTKSPQPKTGAVRVPERRAELASVAPSPAVVESGGPASTTVVANLPPQKLDSEAIIGPQPLLEVAVSEPQPIRSQMSQKERVRSRWQSENSAQQRFLERLVRKASSTQAQH